jgi:hypothetical protein
VVQNAVAALYSIQGQKMTPFSARIGKLFLIASLPLLASTGAFAQATRTWVSGLGDDANPCSRTAPCKTFAGAISKTATGGEISVQDPGGYGAVTITKAITINGEGTHASILSSGVNGVIVNAGANDVVILRNLIINGAGVTLGTNGINFLAGGELHVENVTILDYSQHGINFTPASASALFVHNTSIRNVTTGAIMIKPGVSGTAVAALNNLRMDGNGRGLRAEDGSTVIVRNSHAAGNSANGFVAISTAGTPRAIAMTLENVVSSGNGATGVYAGGPQTIVRLSNTTITNNADGLQMANGGASHSFGNNRISANLGSNGPPTANLGQQ